MKIQRREGGFYHWQKQESDTKCACGCGGFITNRSAKDKKKGKIEGYLKGHGWRGKKMSESSKQKMRENHADVSGKNNPNYGKGLFGEDNPNWQGGKVGLLYGVGNNQKGINTNKDKKFRKEIIKRDKECVLCGRKEMLCCHHIIPWVENENIRFDKNNCVTLCNKCHPRADNKHHYEKYKLMLESYVDNLLI